MKTNHSFVIRHSIVHCALCIAFAAIATHTVLADDYVLSGALPDSSWTEMGSCPSVEAIHFPMEGRSCGAWGGNSSCTSSFVRAVSGGVYSAIFQWRDGTYIKSVKIHFKIENGVLYAKGVSAGYVSASGKPYPYDFDNLTYSTQTYSSTTGGNGYGLKQLTVHVILDGFWITSQPGGVGAADPDFGLVNLEPGASLAVSCQSAWTNAAGNEAATCAGWKLYDAAGALISNGTGNAFTYTHPTPAAYRRLEWQWDMEYKVAATADAGGSVSPAEQWVAPGATATVTATADAGRAFAKWTGDMPGSMECDNPVAFPVTQPCALAAQFTTPGAAWHWTGAGSDALASNPDNWLEETIPDFHASIVFDAGGEGKPCTWDLDIPLQSWAQSNYTSTVTFQTVYDTNGFSRLRIAGDCTLLSGKWTHVANATTYRQYRLHAVVGGNMTIGPDASIDATACGYSQQYIAATGKFYTGGGNYHGGTYGGYGSWNSGTASENNFEPYGSVTAPEDPGSGALTRGGGAIRLDVAGAMSLNGAIDASGGSYAYYTGSGGSVYLRAGTISGNGSIASNGRITGNYTCGSGGRIAIVLTAQGADFSAFDPVRQCTATSITGGDGKLAGAPGTIYAETPADAGRGWLVFKDINVDHSRKYANANPFPLGVASVSAADYSHITVTNNAKIYLAAGTTLDLRGLRFDSADTSGVYLDGGTLVPAADGGIDYDVTTSAGLGGINAASVTFRDGSSLKIDTVDATFAGDLAVDAGVMVQTATALTVDGDLTLNGTVTHTKGPFSIDPEALVLHVTGDMGIGATGLVEMSGKGYTKVYSPPGLAIANFSGSSHGGRGWSGTSAVNQCPVLAYGSITNPVMAGAGGCYRAGGGILLLEVDGALANDGGIQAESEYEATYYGAAGGSVNVRAGSLTGTGRISADCRKMATAYGPAGGGRVAVRLTSPGADFSSYSGEITARGQRVRDAANQWTGGAGTVWLRTAAQGEANGALVVDNMFEGLKNWGDTTVGGSLVEGTDFGDVIVGRSARLNLADGATMHVSGVLSNGCQFVVGSGSTVDFTGAGESRVYGDFSFSNVTCSAAGKIITVDDGATLAIRGVGAFSGTAGSPVTIRSATAGQPWTLDVAGSVTMEGVALRDCQSTVEITVVNGTDLGGNSANIHFLNIAPGELITWTGAGGASWAMAANWDRGRVPVSTDRVLVPSGAPRMPALAADVAVAELTVQQGASLELNGKNLSVAGDASFAGALVASGSETLSVGGSLSLSGDVTPAQSTVLLFSATAQTVSSSAATLYAVEVVAPAAAFSGSLSCDSFTVGDGSSAFDLSFADGASLTANAFAAHGNATATNGVLRCATDGGTWNLTVNQADVSGAAVKGSDASRGVTIVPSDCRDDGGNSNWLFTDDRTHWDGASWSRGAPTAATDAVVDPGASLTVAAPLAVRHLTIATGASLAVSSDLAVGGSLTLESDAIATWDAPGAIGGNLVILPGATLTHSANASTEIYKLDLTVAGSGYVAAGASISATGRGYKGKYGPGTSGNGASHGGRGYPLSGGNPQSPCYGSALCPTNSASGGNFSTYGNSAGGGAIRISFGGPLVLDGSIEADGEPNHNYYNGAGGSVWVTAASLSGSGTLSAHGGDGNKNSGTATGGLGGGGRVALYLTGAASTDAFLGTVSVRGGMLLSGNDTGKVCGSPGTYYLETAADEPRGGTFFSENLRGRSLLNAKANITDIEPAACGVPGEMKKVRMTAGYQSYLHLSHDTRVKDVRLLDSSARLYLNGHILRVGSPRHAVSPDDATQIVYDGGEIIWQQPATVLMLR